ncbi:MAG TPA: LPS export ABC transporter periplasmic protein LptC [Terriglobales bacterium]|nr:LPS export ABC transporter periplasmic protein LptC [Terriglobales bacterium]
MPSFFSRLRVWFGISALLMIAVVAGFYMYARYRVERAVHNLPAKLGVNIQQNTEGFTYSQAAGGHTIFSISASNAVRYKAGGKAELHNVKIVSYGRNSDRLDEITGDDFEYDAQSGDVTAKGKVGIQLQAIEAGKSSPEIPGKKIGSPLHLDTSGLVFNQKTGLAHTSELITFQLPQGRGSAVGATYDSKKNIFSLHSDIHLLTSGPKPVNLHASSALFQQESQEVMLENFRAESGIRHLEAQHVTLHLRDDNTVERADASGGVDAHILGERSAQLHTANAAFIFGPQNQATSGRLTGGVSWETHGAKASRGNAGEVLLAFGRDNQIRSAQLRQRVQLLQLPPEQGGSEKARANEKPVSGTGPVPATANQRMGIQTPSTKPQETEFHGDGLDLQIAEGSRLQKATSVGAAQIILGDGQAAQGVADSAKGKTVIDAGGFEAKFSGENQITTLTGSAPVKIVSSAPGKPDRVSQSQDLLARFSPGKTQTLEQVVQSGNVQIEEDQRTATADRATYDQTTDTMELTGNVRYKDALTGSVLTSNSLALNRSTGETTAKGDVKTTYAEQKDQPTGAMLSPAQAVHVTSAQMVARNSTGAARFSGGARLWQGGNIVQAPVLEFNRKNRTLEGQSQGNQRVSTNFVQPDRSGKKTPVEVIADRLHYEDVQRKAIFDGSIVLRNADSTLHAARAVIMLRSQQQQQTSRSDSAGAPSEVQSIDATGNILLEQPGRRAVGNRLVYTGEEEKFVLTGTPANPPSIFDAEHGQVTGVSLTFFNRDDRVLVDSSNSISITQTRLKK